MIVLGLFWILFCKLVDWYDTKTYTKMTALNQARLKDPEHLKKYLHLDDDTSTPPSSSSDPVSLDDPLARPIAKS